jgi:KipI family sensor histidine kinase inhibitor
VTSPRILNAGEAAIAVEFGNTIDVELNARVRALDEELAAHPFPGLIESVPTYRSLLVHFDPLAASFEEVSPHLTELASRISGGPSEPSPLKEVPTVYDGEDLDAVADHTGLSNKEVIALHQGTEYRVYMLGFSPGFAYMGMLPEAIETPRLTTPRTRVPAGSVAIAGRQTSVYPSSTPGGWSLIGRSSLTLFDAGASPPTFFLPGDRVRFVRVTQVAETTTSVPPQRSVAGEPTFEVLDGGLLTTVQDLGRTGYQRYGVPVAGAADAKALRTANLLVGNRPDAAALECSAVGPKVKFLRTTVVSLCGADLGAVLERGDLGPWPVPSWCSFLARAGNVLMFSGRQSGCRTYVAVAGGVEVTPVLGSRSTYLASGLGGHNGRALKKGDVLYALRPEGRPSSGRRWPDALIPEASSELTVRIVFGLQEDYFSKKTQETLVSSEYVLAPSSDRMGCRLQGPRLKHRGAGEIVTDGMVLGAIQVPPDGLPIVMLADRATTGGYPKIATVIGVDIPRLAQLMPGDKLRFQAVDVRQATEANRSAHLEEKKAARNLVGG